MKRPLHILLVLLLVAVRVSAQDSIPLYSDVVARQQATARPYLGLDVSRAAWLIGSAFRHDQTPVYYRPVSLIYYWPIAARRANPQSAYVSVGYAGYAGVLQRTLYQRGHSAHIRAGIEQHRNGLLVGYGGLLAGWSGDASILFKGPTFGDYLQPTGPMKGLLLGAEGHLGGEIRVNATISLSTVLRATLFARTGNNPDVPPPYLSGLDVLSSGPVGLAASVNANLVFRL